MDAMENHTRRLAMCLGFCLLLGQPSLSQNLGTEHKAEAVRHGALLPKGTLMQIELAQRAHWKQIAPNAVLEGRLTLPVYAGNDVAIPEGTKIELTIESVKKAGNDSGKWRKAGSAVVRAFNPLEKSRPAEYAIRLSKTELEVPQGRIALTATALRAGYAVTIEARAGSGGKTQGLRTTKDEPSSSTKARQTLVLQLDETVALPTSSVPMSEGADASSKRKARAFLLTQLSASGNKKDDTFQARLAEPVQLGDKLFEAGSLLEGRVTQSMRPRILSRAGSLHLGFDRIISPQGTSVPVEGTLAGLESEKGAKYALDEEGGLRGLKPGLKNALVDLSIAYAIGKVTDDVAETPIRAVGAAMSDAAVANAARYFGLGTSAVFLITRHGRDVYLPRYSTIEIDFGRYGEPAGGESASLQY